MSTVNDLPEGYRAEAEAMVSSQVEGWAADELKRTGQTPSPEDVARVRATTELNVASDLAGEALASSEAVYGPEVDLPLRDDPTKTLVGMARQEWTRGQWGYTLEELLGTVIVERYRLEKGITITGNTATWDPWHDPLEYEDKPDLFWEDEAAGRFLEIEFPPGTPGIVNFPGTESKDTYPGV